MGTDASHFLWLMSVRVGGSWNTPSVACESPSGLETWALERFEGMVSFDLCFAAGFDVEGRLGTRAGNLQGKGRPRVSILHGKAWEDD